MPQADAVTGPSAASVTERALARRRRVYRRLAAGLARANQPAECHHVAMVSNASRAYLMPVSRSRSE